MQILSTAIADIVLLAPAVYRDDRGYFLESYNRRTLASLGIQIDFSQDSASFSRRGTLRGLHFQKGEHAQTKLVRAVCGRILDVALDIRAGSPTFGQYVTAELSDENNLQMYIPKGFAHGFAVLSEIAHVAYKTDAYYAPESEGAINATDPDLAIDWQLGGTVCLQSGKDRAASSWEHYCQAPAFHYEGARK